MKRVFFILVVAMIMTGFVAASVSVSAAKAVKFKAVAFLPVNNANVEGFNIFTKMVNKKFKDKIEIDLLGGPEITPPFQLHEAVKNGVIDMCLTSCGYYPSTIWEAQTGMFTNKNFREIALTDYPAIMQKLHNNVGLTWLGHCTWDLEFYMYTNPSINAISDLSGKKIRVFPAFIPLVKALNAVPINLPIGDIYTAMERGAVEGFVMTHLGFVTDFSWNEITKHVINYPLYQATAVILVNQKKWNKLPAHLQEQIVNFKNSTVDPAISKYYKDLGSKSWKVLVDSGVKPISLSEADGEAFLQTAYDSAWTYVIGKSSELGPKLKRMLVK